MKIVRKITVIICLISMILFAQLSFPGTTNALSKESRVLLKINDYYVLYTTPKAPFIDPQNRFMVPLRSLSELLGAKIGYDTKSKVATINMDSKTVTFQLDSKKITVDGNESQMDTIPIMYKSSMFIPLGYLIKNLDIKGKWDSSNRLYTLTGDNLMQSDMIKNYEDLDTREGPVKSNNAFMPISYLLDMSSYKITIKSKNKTGVDLPKGVEDVHPFFIFGNSAVFDKIDRERPAVRKDGFVEYTWTFTPSIVDNKLETLKYILVKGRIFDSNS